MHTLKRRFCLKNSIEFYLVLGLAFANSTAGIAYSQAAAEVAGTQEGLKYLWLSHVTCYV